MKLTISFPAPAPAYPRRKLITWAHPTAIADGYCAACRPKDDGTPQGQYSMAPVHIMEFKDGKWVWINTYSENTGSTRITNSEFQKIASLQIPDEKTVDQKMVWASDGGDDTWGQIIRATYPGSDWRSATDIKMIAAVWAGQWVEVVERATFYTNLNGNKGMTPMSRIRTYQPHEWGEAYATQLVTAVTSENVYYERPKGYFHWPLWFGARQVWCFDRWLEAV